MENKGGGAGESLFPSRANHIPWLMQRVKILMRGLCVVFGFGSLLVSLHVLHQFAEIPGSKHTKLADIKVLTFRPGQKTSGWRTPEQHPQLICTGRICPVTPNEVNCYNVGLDKFNCKADMGLFYRFIYGLDESTVVCEGGCRNSVVEGSCYLIYSLQNNWVPKMINVIFAVFVLRMLYVTASQLISPSHPSQEKREEITSGITSAPPLSPPLPVSSEISPSTIEITENGSSAETGQTGRDAWSDLNGEQQRSLMYRRGFSEAIGNVLAVAIFIAFTILVQKIQMPKSTQILML